MSYYLDSHALSVGEPGHQRASIFNQALETLSHLESLGITTEEESFSFISQGMDGVPALDGAASLA